MLTNMNMKRVLERMSEFAAAQRAETGRPSPAHDESTWLSRARLVERAQRLEETQNKVLSAADIGV
jgi:hypothetical protein